MKIIKTDQPQECRECKKPSFYLLEIGERPDWETATTRICFDCINKALNVVKIGIPKSKRRVTMIVQVYCRYSNDGNCEGGQRFCVDCEHQFCEKHFGTAGIFRCRSCNDLKISKDQYVKEAKVVGKVFNEVEEKFQSVIGYEFRDTPGYFQFFEIGTNGHFRKRPVENDEIAPISQEIFNQLKIPEGE